MGNAIIGQSVGGRVESLRLPQEMIKTERLRLIVDHSQTATTSRTTGIERVVRCLVSHLPACVNDTEIVSGLHLYGDFFALDHELQKALRGLGDFEQKATQSYPAYIRNALTTVTKN